MLRAPLARVQGSVGSGLRAGDRGTAAVFEEYPVDGVAVAVRADVAQRAQSCGFPDLDGAKEGERMMLRRG
jgi:hypothetical protein